MKPGSKFENSGMKLVCIAFYSLEKRNVGLFQRESDGMYITARNTSKEADGSYSWAWGHYFPTLEDAEKDYHKRLEEMCQYTD
jgi:hypothetical protein